MNKKGYDQKSQAGRGNMMKTGKGIPPQFYGPQMAQDGPIDDLVSGAKKVAKKVGSKISQAHKAGMKKYNENTSAASYWGGSGVKRGRNYNPVNYVTGAIGSLMD
jgi:hypothetical protein